MKENNYLRLCMRYSESCKLCPRNKKCEEELREETIKRRRGDKSDFKKRNKSKRNRRKIKNKIKL